MENEKILKSKFHFEFWNPVIEENFSDEIINYCDFIEQLKEKMLNELNDFIDKINPHMIGTIDFIKEKKNEKI